MKTNIHFRSYLAQLFLKWKMFHTKVVEKLETHILFSIFFFFRKLCRLWDNVGKCYRAEEATDENMAQARCMLDNYGYKYTVTAGCTIIIVSPLKQWWHRHASMWRYTYTAWKVAWYLKTVLIVNFRRLHSLKETPLEAIFFTLACYLLLQLVLVTSVRSPVISQTCVLCRLWLSC